MLGHSQTVGAGPNEKSAVEVQGDAGMLCGEGRKIPRLTTNAFDEIDPDGVIVAKAETAGRVGR